MARDGIRGALGLRPEAIAPRRIDGRRTPGAA